MHGAALTTRTAGPQASVLPAWVEASPVYHVMPHRLRLTLHTIARACTERRADGSLIGARGGRELADEAGVCLRTLWSHVSRLEAAGLIATLRRGGPARGGINHANIYGVPGSPGALDSWRCHRRMQRMWPDAAGTHRPEVIRPGQQVTLWPQSGPSPAAPAELALVQKNCTTLVQNCTTPPGPERDRQTSAQPRLARQSRFGMPVASGSGTGSFRESESKNQNQRNTSTARRPGSPGPRVATMRDVRAEDLRQVERLVELHADAVARCGVPAGERGLLIIAATAEHALRVGDRPEALFAAMVRKAHWLHITQADEDAAQARLRRHREALAKWTATDPSTSPTPQRPATSRPEPSRITPPTDAEVVARLLRMQREDRPASARRMLVDRAGWTPQRFDAALDLARRAKNGGGITGEQR